jgi:hypothetical protein
MRPVKKIVPSHLAELPVTNTVDRATFLYALVESLGNYCSYCEMPLSDYHKEHLRYFAHWPEHLLVSQWDDLLLICNDCRSHIRTPVLNELSAASLLWPDEDITFSLHNSPLQYELRNVNYVVIDEEGDKVSEENRQLVFVVANPQASSSLYQKAFNTISHFQLNMKLEFYDEATNELRVPISHHMERLDNRMFKRTAAWFDADATVTKLKELEGLIGGKSESVALREAFINQIAMTAWYSGNWSVWMTVFYQRTGDIELMRKAFAGTTHVFAGLNNENNQLFRTE